MAAVSGKFVLRLPPPVHAELKRLASQKGLSLNEFCTLSLAGAAAGSAPQNELDLDVAIAKARRLHGQALVGVAIYGSWARGTATQASDLDLLIVLDSGIQVSRQMYRDWDQQTLTLQGHLVEPSIVTLPADASEVSGFWAEIATEGLLCWWRDFSVHRYLTKVREKIAAGELRRERSHGQSYWVHRTEVA